MRLPSAQDINRQAPTTARQVVGLSPDRSGAALAQIGGTITQVADNAIVQQQREQEIQKKELLKVQEISEGTNLRIAMNDSMNALRDDPNYETHGTKFEEGARKSLMDSVGRISDPNAAAIFKARGEAAISSQKQQVLNKAYQIRDDQSKARVIGAVEYASTNYGRGATRNDRNRTLAIGLENINAEAGRSLSYSEAESQRIKLQNSAALQEIDMLPAEKKLALLQGKPIAPVTSTGNAVADEAIMSAASLHDVPVDALMQIAMVESSGNPNARSPSGKHLGLFQFGEDAAKDVELQDRLNPYENAIGMAKRYTMLKEYLTDTIGREPSAGEIYLAHQQGQGGASALLSNPDMSAVDALATIMDRGKAQASIIQNGGNLSMTAAQFANKWIGEIDGSIYAGDVAKLDAGQRQALENQANATLNKTVASLNDAASMISQGFELPQAQMDTIRSDVASSGSQKAAMQLQKLESVRDKIQSFSSMDVNGLQQEADRYQQKLTDAQTEGKGVGVTQEDLIISKAVNAKLKAAIEMQQKVDVQNKVAGAVSGAQYIDPSNKDQMKVYGDALSTQYLDNPDVNPLERNNAISQVVRNVGFVPKSVTGRIDAVFRGQGNDDDIIQYADLYSRIEEFAPQSINDFNKQTRIAASMVTSSIRAGVNPADAVAAARFAMSKENEPIIEARKIELQDKEMAASIKQSALGAFDTWIPFEGKLDVGIPAVQQMAEEYRKAYADVYSYSGDKDLSESYALKAITAVYGKTDFNNGSVMKYRPELYYSFPDQPDGWMQQDLLEDVAKKYPNDFTIEQPQSASLEPLASNIRNAQNEKGKIKPEDVYLISDSQTAYEAGTGSPSYQVIIKKEGSFYAPEKWRFRPDKERQIKARKDAAALEVNNDTTQPFISGAFGAAKGGM